MRSTRLSILALMMTLVGAGVVMIYSTTSIPMWQSSGQSSLLLKRQLLYVFFGFVVMLVCMMADYRQLQKWAKPILLVSLIPLLLLFFPGMTRQAGGARRWLHLFGLSYQPSEAVKLALVIYLADFLSRKAHLLGDLRRGFLPPVSVVAFTALLVLFQPDFGTAVSLIVLGFTLLFIAGMRISYLFSTVLAALPLLYLAVWRVPYRRARISVFLNPWLDPQGSGFQIIQSQIALGSGGFWGLGLGEGKQKLFYLPAAHTDFIFSIIGEELGFLGAGAIILLFVLLLWKMFRVVLAVTDPFGKLLCAGVLTLIAFSAVVNIGVSLGCFPTKGLPLPFVSYGGSSLVFHMAAIALLLNVSKTEEVAV